MKLIQLNIWDGRLIMQAIPFLKKEDPDIVNLQEVGAGMDVALYFTTYQKLKSALNYKYTFYAPWITTTFAGREVSFGQLIMSKYPITYKNLIFTHGQFTRNHAFDKAIFDVRALQHARIKIGKEVINDLSYHGYLVFNNGRMGNSVTEADSKKILRYMKSLDHDEKIMLTGDFNLSPRSESLKILSEDYENLILKYKIKTTRNQFAFDSVPVDNIFVNDRVKVRSFRVPKVLISDHLPLVMNFD